MLNENQIDSGIGAEVQRSEDNSLLNGKGQFGDDLGFPKGTLHVAVLRSPHAAAKIINIDTKEATSIVGVHSVIDGNSFSKISKPLLSVLRINIEVWPCAINKVRYVGEPIALILAENRYIAEDAVDKIKVKYKKLIPVIDPEKAIEKKAIKVHQEVESNIVSDRNFSYGNPKIAFKEADKIIELKIQYPRNSCTPLEGFVIQSDFNKSDKCYTVKSNFQGPFSLHPVIARSLGVNESGLRMISNQDSGGSFGIKQAILPMIVLTCLASRISGKNIMWTEDRLEHLTAASSATNRVTKIKAALKKNGKIIGLEYDQIDDVGAYLRAPEPASLYRMHGNLSGAYLIENIYCRNRVVLTNKTPTGLNRGFGGPQHYYALERLMHNIANEMKIDRLELIKINLVKDNHFPYSSASGAKLDSGQYEKLITKVELSDAFKEIHLKKKIAEKSGKIYGIGYAAIVEPSISNMGYITTALPYKERETSGHKGGAIASASVSIGPTGGVYVTCDSVPQGQGHKTVLAQVVAEIFGLDFNSVLVNSELDTQKDAWSIAAGNYSSRFAGAVAGTTSLAAEKLKHRLTEIAVSKLNCKYEDILFKNNLIFDKNNLDNSISFQRLAGSAHWTPGELPLNSKNGLREVVHWSPQELEPPNKKDQINGSLAYGFVFDVCGLEINPLTGSVSIDRYITGHDAGKIINPLLANGQIYGAFAHGVGAALFEEFKYSDDGSFLSGTFADYLLPSTCDVPEPDIIHIETPSPYTPLGAKGLGEGNCMSTPVAIANAACDALKVKNVQLPLTHSKVYSYLTKGKTEKKRKSFIKTEPVLNLGNNNIKGSGITLIPLEPHKALETILNIETLMKTLPGCENLQVSKKNLYTGTIKIGFGPIRGIYNFAIQLSNLSKPNSIKLKGEASGALGIVSGEGFVSLYKNKHRKTELSYKYQAEVSGKIAAVGGRLINTASKIIIKQFFDALTREINPSTDSFNIIKYIMKIFGGLR